MGCRLEANKTAVRVVFEPLAPSIFASGKTPHEIWSSDIMTYHANFATTGEYLKSHSGGKEVALRDMTIKGVPMWCLAPLPRGHCKDTPYHCPPTPVNTATTAMLQVPTPPSLLGAITHTLSLFSSVSSKTVAGT